MRTKLTLTTAAALGAVSLALTTATPANAETTSGTVGCNTSGAHGEYRYSNYHGPDATVTINFTLTDTAADGNSVRVRMISMDTHGAVTSYPWRVNSGGYLSTSEWQTTASNRGGLFDIGIEVARANKDGSIRNFCTRWV
ncbi:hypothetical protein [Streptomyces sp. NPDC090025]|uniref:hypothetical protein n=1 Tax=Streptomyces sp. NPDC090025 TaxID=3365922 RepID=UPI003836D559